MGAVHSVQKVQRYGRLGAAEDCCSRCNRNSGARGRRAHLLHLPHCSHLSHLFRLPAVAPRRRGLGVGGFVSSAIIRLPSTVNRLPFFSLFAIVIRFLPERLQCIHAACALQALVFGAQRFHCSDNVPPERRNRAQPAIITSPTGSTSSRPAAASSRFASTYAGRHAAQHGTPHGARGAPARLLHSTGVSSGSSSALTRSRSPSHGHRSSAYTPSYARRHRRTVLPLDVWRDRCFARRPERRLR